METSSNQAPQSVAEAQETQKFRSQMGHISRHSAVFFAGTIFSAAAGYLFKVYLARVLGAEALGLYALGMTIVGVFSIFGGLGLSQSAVRFVAAYRARNDYQGLRSFIWKSSGLLVALNVLLGAAIGLVGPGFVKSFYHAPSLIPHLRVFAAIMILGSLTTFWSQVLVGYREVARRTVISNFVGTTLIIVLTVLLFVLGLKSLGGYLLAQVITPLAILVLLLLSVRRLMPQEARGLPLRFEAFPREVVHFSVAVFGIDFVKFLLSQSDKVFLGIYLTPRDVGVYSIANAVVVYVALILQAVNQVFSPTIADLHAREEGEILRRLFRTLTKWIIGLTLPLAAVVIAFARPIMSMFGSAFEVGWPILVIGTIGQLVSCGVGSVGFLLLMSGHQKRLLRVQVGMAIVMLTLNISLIPWLGIVGAAIAAAATNIGTNLWSLREVRRNLGLTPYDQTYLRLVGPTLVMVTLLVGIRFVSADVHPRWLVIAVATLLSYVTLVAGMLLVGLDADDKLIVEAVRGKVRGTFQQAVGTVQDYDGMA